MALTVPQQNMVLQAVGASKELSKLYGLLLELDVLWNGSPAYSAMTEADLLAYMPGIGSKQRLSDLMAGLANVKTDITNALPAFSVTSSL